MRQLLICWLKHRISNWDTNDSCEIHYSNVIKKSQISNRDWFSKHFNKGKKKFCTFERRSTTSSICWFVVPCLKIIKVYSLQGKGTIREQRFPYPLKSFKRRFSNEFQLIRPLTFATIYNVEIPRFLHQSPLPIYRSLSLAVLRSSPQLFTDIWAEIFIKLSINSLSDVKDCSQAFLS